jgi:glycosyltransferase involved in cell wall biosynthesis
MEYREKFHVIILNLIFDDELPSAKDLLIAYESLKGWANGLRKAGLRVTVVQRFWRDEHFSVDGVEYFFIKDQYEPWLNFWQIPYRVFRILHNISKHNKGDSRGIIHINGLMFPLQSLHLRWKIPDTYRIVMQHHAEKPMRGLKKIVQRWGLAVSDGFLFSAKELAQPWFDYRIIRGKNMVYQVMEGSTFFGPQDSVESKKFTSVIGSPVFLWVGRLNANKDPLSVLIGFDKLLAYIPNAKLYMIYHTQELLPKIHKCIEDRFKLKNSVILLGEITHSEMEYYYNSVDYFVLGSHYEGSGFALVEALACGVVPIVTDIPSFRMMTDEGRIGGLWSVGDVNDFVQTAFSTLEKPLRDESFAAREFFDEKLSFSAIGIQAVSIYIHVTQRYNK